MGLLEDYIGQPLDKIGDTELDELMMKGRLAREQRNPTKAAKIAKEKKEKVSRVSVEELDLFD